MKIQVYGTGCPGCKNLAELTQKAVAELGIDTEVEYITDIKQMVEKGFMTSPVLVVNDEPVLMGGTSDIDRIKELIAK